MKLITRSTLFGLAHQKAIADKRYCLLFVRKGTRTLGLLNVNEVQSDIERIVQLVPELKSSESSTFCFLANGSICLFDKERESLLRSFRAIKLAGEQKSFESFTVWFFYPDGTIEH